METFMGEAQRTGQFLTSWAIFGANVAASHEKGLVHVDLNPGNIMVNPKTGDLLVIDFKYLDTVDFYHQWNLLPTPLYSLLSWLDISATAAFRFGYLHYSGPIGYYIFDILRKDFGIYSLNIPEISYSLSSDQETLRPTEKITQSQRHWVEKREGSSIAHMDNLPESSEHLCSQLRTEAYKHRELNPKLSEYLHGKRLAIMVTRSDVLGTISTLLDIADLYDDRQETLRAFGISYFAIRFLELGGQVPENIRLKFAERSRKSNAKDLERWRYFLEVILRSGNIFHGLWCIDDLSVGEFSIVETASIVNEKHFTILSQGVEAWNTWREQNPNIQPDLSGLNLQRMNLRGINLRGVNLTGADLAEANLTGADLQGADLRGAKFTRAILRGAKL